MTYDPKKISYSKLLQVYWHNIDPTVRDRQFCDSGNEYRTVIFFHDPEQEREAKESEAELAKSKPFTGPIVTEIVPASTFYPAEDYHQEFYRKNPTEYGLYRLRLRTRQRLREIWGDASGGD